jgi:hypothetical protein
MRVWQRSKVGGKQGALTGEMLLAVTAAHINVFVAGTEKLGLSTTKIFVMINWIFNSVL